jgi:hypothetical protein
MRREDIDNDFKNAAFEYFYWFSRFEFALKENKYLKSGDKAEPNWDDFISKMKEQYELSKEAEHLIDMHPKRQMVTSLRELEWKPVGTDHCDNDLCKVVTMLKTVRNNLFHGGKHGDIDVDSKKRNLELLETGKLVLDQFSVTASIVSDYRRIY